MNFGGDHSAPGHGKISPRCVLKLPTMARNRPDAFPCCRPWRDCAPMRSRRGLGRGKRRFAATYRRHVFRYSLFWQDMHAMYPKSPAKCRWGIRRANILPPRGVFAVRSPQIMHGARILPPSGGPAPAQGLLPEQPHHRIAFQRLGPCPGVPAPAPRRYPPPANACRLPCPLQPEASRRWASAAVIRRIACSPAKPRGTADCIISTGRPTTECCAEPGLDSRTVSKWAQNLRRRPQAGPGLRQRCQKRPSKGRVPLDGAIGTPSPKRRISANSAACAFASAHKGHIRQNAYHRLGNTNLEHDAPPSPARTNRYRFSAERRWQPNLQA